MLVVWVELATRQEKGDGSNLCKAPSGPFRQIGLVPFFPRTKISLYPTAFTKSCCTITRPANRTARQWSRWSTASPPAWKSTKHRSTPELRRRQGGYGRGGRQKLESDHVEILSGLWHGRTIGSPIALLVRNNDYKIEQMEDLTCPRPGHGDLNGSIKYLGSVRGILERASARETTARIAAGALAKQLLTHFGIDVFGYVVAIGPIDVSPRAGTLDQQRELRQQSELYILDPSQDANIKALVARAGEQGDTLGGLIEVRVEGVPFGLGSHTQWDKKLSGRLAQAVMSIQAIKGFEIGMGFQTARHFGSEVHDPIHYDAALVETTSLGFVRPTNHAGGLEAGMSNAAADRPSCRDEADQHACPAVALSPSRHEGARIRLLRTQRHLRRPRCELRRRERRCLRDCPGDGRQIRRRQPR